MRVCSSCGEENPDKAKFCLECATALTEAETPRETRKTVTVLFADMSGSTALGERLDPEALRVVIERYFEAMKIETERHGGLVEKFIGDAVMAVFGIPRAHEDDALRAIRAAMGLHEALDELNIGLERDHGVAIRVRVGINTGEVVTGDATERQRLVTGDTVNVAARFEQAATPGEMLIGRDTWRLVRDAVEVEAIAPLDLKGKSEPQPAYRVTGLIEGAESIARRTDTAFVGRGREVGLLRDARDRVQADRSSYLFTVLGIAGVGKSRLVAEVLDAVGDDMRVLSGRCLPYGDGITFWPVAEMLKASAGITDAENPEAVRAKLRAAMSGEDDSAAVESALAALLGLATGGGALEETFWAFRRYVETLSQGGALALVFDDIHWAAQSLLDLIEHLVDWLRDMPVLIICLARPEFLDERPGWGGGKMNAATILLEPLNEEDASHLIGGLLDATELPAELTTRIVRAAEGNPLFVEEVLAKLVDDGSLIREQDGWRQTKPLGEIELPASIQALLSARLDQLEPAELRVIEGGSIVGQVFYRGALADLAPESLALDVGTYLKSLVRKDLVRPERGGFPGDETYRFRHILIRDAAYRAMPKRTRADLHERFADWLERTAGERIAEFEEIVAHHLEQAVAYRSELGEPAVQLAQQANRVLLRAGRRAMEMGDIPAAIALFSRATDLGGSEERASANLALSFGHFSAGELEQALNAVDESQALADLEGHRGVSRHAELKRLELLESFDPGALTPASSRQRVESIMTEFEDEGDALGLAAAWLAMGTIEWTPGRFDASAAAVEKSIHYLAEADDHGTAWGVNRRYLHMYLLGSLLFGSMPVVEAKVRTRAAFTNLGSGLVVEAIIGQFEAEIASMEGRFAEGRALVEKAIGITRELRFVAGEHACLESRANVERRAGNKERFLVCAREFYEAMHATGDVGVSSTAAAFVAEGLFAHDDLAGAHEYADIAVRTSAANDFSSQANGRSVQAMIAARKGDHASASVLIDQAVERCADVQWPEEVGHVFLARAEVMRSAGDLGEARASGQHALRLFAAKGSVPMAERAKKLLAVLEES